MHEAPCGDRGTITNHNSRENGRICTNQDILPDDYWTTTPFMAQKFMTQNRRIVADDCFTPNLDILRKKDVISCGKKMSTITISPNDTKGSACTPMVRSNQCLIGNHGV